ncbi:MAG: hypothetical protein ACOCQD_02080 [archaeon]
MKLKFHLKTLKKGMQISLYEPDGKRVQNKKGNTVFTADSDAYLNADGILTFETKE